MKFIIALALSTLLLSPGAVEAQSKPKPKPPAKGAVAKKIYCWEDAGKKVCGDAMPASAVNSARTEINARTGTVTRSVERSLTPEERAAIEAQKKAALEQAQQQQTQTEQGQMLLMVYPSEQALNLAFDERVATVKKSNAEAIKVKKEAQVVLVDRLEALSGLEMAGKPITKTALESLERLRIQVQEHDAILARQQQAVAQIEAERQQALNLYRATTQALVSTSAPTATPTPTVP
jgi:hypothetical protein